MSGAPKPYTILDAGDFGDGCAMVLPDDITDPMDALVVMVGEGYGGEGETWSRENAVLVEALKDVRVETWRSCTKAYLESNCIDAELYPGGWWAPDGDGKREIRVVSWISGDVYTLGEAADAWERGTAAAGDG